MYPSVVTILLYLEKQKSLNEKAFLIWYLKVQEACHNCGCVQKAFIEIKSKNTSMTLNLANADEQL